VITRSARRERTSTRDGIRESSEEGNYGRAGREGLDDCAPRCRLSSDGSVILVGTQLAPVLQPTARHVLAVGIYSQSSVCKCHDARGPDHAILPTAIIVE
jgi:hypothetical protein